MRECVISYADNVPQWLRRLVRRHYKRFGIDWRLSVLVVEGDAIDGRCAVAVMEIEYRRADLIFNAALRNDEEAAHAVRHELLHLIFAPIQRYLEQSLPKKMPGRRIILAHIDDLIETAIEQLLKAI